MEIDDIETKHDEQTFVAGDLSDDFKKLIKIIKKQNSDTKIKLKNLDDRLKFLEGV